LKSYFMICIWYSTQKWKTQNQWGRWKDEGDAETSNLLLPSTLKKTPVLWALRVLPTPSATLSFDFMPPFWFCISVLKLWLQKYIHL
jgi:hypothetical protein